MSYDLIIINWPIINKNMQYQQNSISTTYQDHYPGYQPPSYDYVRFNNVGASTIANRLPFIDHYPGYVRPYLNPELYQPYYPRTPYYSTPAIKFEGESRYKSDFKDSSYMEEIRHRHLNSEKINRRQLWTQEKVPFDGSSSYKSQFQPYRVETAPSVYNTYSPQRIQTSKFDDTTTYGSDYKDIKIKYKPRDRCDAQLLPVPSINNINNKKHIYYDSVSGRFI